MKESTTEKPATSKNKAAQVPQPAHNVYVIELDPAVLENKKFREANPNYRDGLPCVYVGMTGLSPEERFQNHRNGVKSSKYPRLYGLCLLPDLYADINPMLYADACKAEVDLAEELRGRGYGVWQA